MNKLFFILMFLFLSTYMFADTAAELIAEYENLSKEKQAILREKNKFFTVENIDKFKKLTPPQQDHLVEKLNIDIELITKQLREIQKKTKAVKKDDKKLKDKTNEFDENKDFEENEKDKNKSLKNKMKEVKEIEKTDLEKLKEQYEPIKDERQILSNITSIDEDKEDDDRVNRKNETDDFENKKNQNEAQDKKGEVSDAGEKKYLKNKFQKDKDFEDDTSKEIRKDFNIIDAKMNSSIKGLQVIKEIPKYGYDLFKSSKNDDNLFETEEAISVRDDYLIGPNDELNVQLYGNKSKKVTLTVDNEGKAYFPEIGPINLNGLTFKETKKLIENLVSEKMLNTSVYVTASNIRKSRVFLMGEFEKPGLKNVLSSNSLLDILIQSGGIKEIGSLRKIQINRDSKVVAEIDLYDFIQKGIFDHSIIVKDNDIIFCPVIENRVTVVGAVVRPAFYEIKKDTTIKDVIAISGGMRADAYLQNVKVDKSVGYETREVVELDLRDESSKNWDFIIKNGDIISVDNIPFERSNSVFVAGNAKRPGVYAWKEGLLVTDILKNLDDVKAETDLSYAVIERINPKTKKPELVSFNLENVISKKTEKVPLLSNDKIIIYSLTDFQERPVVKADGQFINPEQYEYYDGMRVTDLVLAAGGLRADAYLDRAEVIRWNKETDSFNVFKINLKKLFEPENNIKLMNRDKLTVHSMWDVGTKEFVEIKGFVNKPGKYLFYNEMKLGDLIFASGSFKEFADLSFVAVNRKTTSKKGVFSLEFISVNYKKVLDGSTEDLELKAGDSIEIFEIKKFIKDASVIVIGEVKKPGPYQWGEGIKISDLIKLSGGLEKSAYLKSAELTHYEIVNGEQRFVAHETISLEKIQDGDTKEDKLLNPYDELNILKIPGWNQVATVEIKGEVLYPGIYSIEKGEKITDLIQRAGGLTDNAYPFAAFFSREKIRKTQREQLDKRVEELERRLAEVDDSKESEDVGKSEASRQNLEQLILRIKEAKVTGRISLNLDIALENQFNANNLTLEGNDILIIPRKANVVNVIGEVRNPTTFILNSDLGVKDYILKSGGYSDYANSSKVYVVRADGSVAYLKKSGFKSSVLVYKDQKTSKLLPGDTIVIPEKLDRYSGMKLTKDISQILFQVSLAVAAFASL